MRAPRMCLPQVRPGPLDACLSAPRRSLPIQSSSPSPHASGVAPPPFPLDASLSPPPYLEQLTDGAFQRWRLTALPGPQLPHGMGGKLLGRAGAPFAPVCRVEDSRR
ncbi:unnamed protein product [Urochloa humidicola]